jgi:nucleoside-diphosphate-sugar epimerase
MRVAVTGAFGYSGRYITKRLLEAGHEVITLTNSLHRPNPFGEKVTAFAFHFDEPEKLRDSLRGVQALVNTYWVEEIRGLMEGRLYVNAPPLGTTKLTEWIEHHRDALGRRYTSEMARRVDRSSSYGSN